MCMTKISIFLPELKRPTFHLSIWCLNYFFGREWSPDSPAPYFHLPREEFTGTPTWPACVPIGPLSCPRPHVAMHAHGFPILSMVPRGHTCLWVPYPVYNPTWPWCSWVSCPVHRLTWPLCSWVPCLVHISQSPARRLSVTNPLLS